MKTLRRALLGAALSAFAISSTPSSALNIVLNPTANFGSQPNGAAALQGFQAAANFWNTFLTNDATINLTIDYRALGSGIIGSAGSRRVDVLTTDVYAGLAANAQTQLDAIAVANLPTLTAAGGLGYRMPDSVTGIAGTGTGLGVETASRGSVYDNDDSYNNLVMYANTANLKALGLAVANPNSADAAITFSSAFAFDFDPSDGLTTGTQDFISVAVHEIGHALGFVSGTDFYDQYGSPNGLCDDNGTSCGGFIGNQIDWDQESVLSIWDLYRYSTNPPSNAGFDPATGKRYIQTDPNRGAAFSIDGVHFFNAQNEDEAEFANLSTGRYNGDGQQASHWKDATGFFDENGCFISSRQVGILDPTSGTCQPGVVTANDLAAFDAMGYNLNFDILQDLGFTYTSAQIFQQFQSSVPEPASWAMMIAGFGFVGASMRRRTVKVAVTA